MIKSKSDAIECAKAAAQEFVERELNAAEIEFIEAMIDEFYDRTPSFDVEIDGEPATVFER